MRARTAPSRRTAAPARRVLLLGVLTASSRLVGGSAVAARRTPETQLDLSERLRHSALLVISGGVAAGLAKTAVAPLERLKLLSQLGATRGISMGGALAQVVRNEGVAGLWRGNMANCFRAFPQKGVLLMSSEIFRELAAPICARLHFLPSAATVGGALAGVSSALLSYPLDVIFTTQAGTLVIGKASQTSVLATARAIIARGGITALYAGAGFTMLSSLPYEGLKFGSYAAISSRLMSNGEGSNGALLQLCAGAGAGAIAHSATYPLDTVRRRLQAGSGPAGSNAILSAWLCARALAREGGAGAFYRGLPVTVIRTLPNTGLQFFFYERIKRSMGLSSAASDEQRRAREARRSRARSLAQGDPSSKLAAAA